MKTRGGGHSVQFTDVEVLKHSHSITNSPRVKPRHKRTPKDTQKRSHLAGIGKTSSTHFRAQYAKAAGNMSAEEEGAAALSCSSSPSSVSGAENSLDEHNWTDVETRVWGLYINLVQLTRLHSNLINLF